MTSPGSLRSRPPVIGLTTYRQQVRSGVWHVEGSFLPAVYLDGVTGAGGVATLLPPQPAEPDVVSRALDGIDALVLTGGADVDPARYAAPPHPQTDLPAVARDGWELALLDGALRRGLPVLGICRGAQLLNVAFGGTLHQHLPDVLGHGRHRLGDARFGTSTVRTVPGTRLAGLIGEGTDAQCYHHQAIDAVGDGLIVAATSADGVVEAIETDHETDHGTDVSRYGPGDAPTVPDRPFVLGVQWHPEQRLDDLRLFAGVVAAAAARTTTEGHR